MTGLKNAIDDMREILQERVIKSMVGDIVDLSNQLQMLMGSTVIEAMSKSVKILHELNPLPDKAKVNLKEAELLKKFKKQHPDINPELKLTREQIELTIVAYALEHPDRIFGSDSDEN